MRRILRCECKTQTLKWLVRAKFFRPPWFLFNCHNLFNIINKNIALKERLVFLRPFALPPVTPGSHMNQGLWATAGSFFIWGLFPLYWRLLSAVPPTQIMAHRIVWCAALAGGFLPA